MTTGQHIKAARKKAGMTQAALAEKLGISYVGVSQWENDLRNPKLETLRRIALALGTAVSELVGPDYWSNLSPEERVNMWKASPPPQIPTDAQDRITTALGKPNNAGMEKAADAVEIIAEVPRYQRSQPPEGMDTAPSLDGPEGPQEGGER